MMNQEDIFRKIGLILNELQDQYEYLAKNPAQLNELELELFMANASFLSDHVQIVMKINNSKVVKELPEYATETPETEIKQEQKTIPVSASPELFITEELSVKQEVAIHEKEAIMPEIEISQENEWKPVQEFKVEDEVFTEEKPDVIAEQPAAPAERELFKLDQEPATFEFILKDIDHSDKFDFEEKSVDDIFDRPLSEEEERIIAQKKKLRDQQLQAVKELGEDDEVGPEPFLVAKEEDVVPAASTEFMVDEVAAKEVPASIHVTLPEQIEKPVTANQEREQARPTLNELLASQNGNRNLNSENNRAVITDLKQAINLNDKMLYIKDLFNGYNLAYAEVIDLINKMPDFKTADAFLQNNYAVKNNWASKQNTVDRFYELLNQRFQIK